MGEYMGKFMVLLKKEMAELWGTKKLMILGIVFLFFAILSVVSAKLMPELLKSMPSTPGLIIKLPTPTYKDAIDQLLKNIAQLGALIMIFVIAGAIADEKSKKTLEMVVTKPISRSSFVLAKAFSYIGAVKLTFLVSLAVFYGYTVAVFGSFSLLRFIELAILMLVFMVLMVCTLIFTSVISSSGLIASGLGFLGYIVYVGIWGLFGAIKDYSPGYVISNYKVVVEHGWNKDFLWPALVSVGLSIIWLWLAVYIFERQEVER